MSVLSTKGLSRDDILLTPPMPVYPKPNWLGIDGRAKDFSAYDELFEFIYKRPANDLIWDYLSWPRANIFDEQLNGLVNNDKWDIKILVANSLITYITSIYITPPYHACTLTVTWPLAGINGSISYLYSGVNAFALRNDVEIGGNLTKNEKQKWARFASIPWIMKNGRQDLMEKLVLYSIDNDCFYDLLPFLDDLGDMEAKVEVLHIHNELVKRNEGGLYL